MRTITRCLIAVALTFAVGCTMPPLQDGDRCPEEEVGFCEKDCVDDPAGVRRCRYFRCEATGFLGWDSEYVEVERCKPSCEQSLVGCIVGG